MEDANWWEPWAAEVVNGYVRPPATARMRAQPGFHDAVRYSIQATIEAAEHDADLRRMTPDTPARFLALAALYLDINGGLTHRRLREAAGMHGVLSNGRVTALLMRMRLLGLVEIAEEDGPGRRKLYRPTARMEAALRRLHRSELEAILRMRPETERLLEAYDGAEGFPAFVTTFGGLVLEAVRRQGRAPDPQWPASVTAFKVLSERVASMAILMTILDDAAARAGRFPAAGPARTPVSALGRRFGVSRTHVRHVIRAAVVAGFLRAGAEEGCVEVEPALIEAIEDVYGMAFTVYAGCAHLGLRSRPTSASHDPARAE